MTDKYASPNTYPKRPNPKPGVVDLKPEEFDNLIEDQGVKVRITPTAVCPNKDAIEGTNHVLDCPLCGGDEVLEFEDQCEEVWAFIQSLKLDKQFEVNGIFDIKDAQITTKSTTRLYYWYKIEVLDFSSIFNQLVKRGVSGNLTDKLRYEPATSCDTPYILRDSLGKNYVLNEHYKVEPGKILRWLGNNRPKDGTLYTLLYPILPTFRVLEMMHENRYYYKSFKSPVRTPINLPQNAIIRWDYLAKRQGSNEVLGTI